MDLNTIQIYNYIGIDGNTSFINTALIGRHVFNCFKDGIQFMIINSGTPVDKEVLVNTTTGELTFAVQFETNEIATVLYF
jgi:hypothetical protein